MYNLFVSYNYFALCIRLSLFTNNLLYFIYARNQFKVIYIIKG